MSQDGPVSPSSPRSPLLKTRQNKPPRITLPDAVISDEFYDAMQEPLSRANTAKIISSIRAPEFEVEQRTARSNTPLLSAVIHNQFAAVEELLSLGAAVDVENKSKRTPIFEALSRNLADIAALLIPASDKITARWDGGTYLHIAAIHCFDAAPIFLIMDKIAPGHRKTFINIQDDDGKTALHYAVEDNSEAAVWGLLECGANTSITDEERKTAKDYCKTESMYALLERFAARRASFEDPQTARKLPSIINEFKKSALHEACFQKDIPLIRGLIKLGYPIDYIDHNKSTLHVAVASQSLAVVEELLDQMKRLPPLVRKHYFAWKECWPQWLPMGKTALQMAFDSRIEPIIAALRKMGESLAVAQKKGVDHKNAPLVYTPQFSELTATLQQFTFDLPSLLPVKSANTEKKTPF
jgi:ankyrin repeat protein